MSSDRYHDGTYAAANPGWHAQDAPAKASELREMLDALGWRPAHILDVGCGTGDVLRELRALLLGRVGAPRLYEGWEVGTGLVPATERDLVLRRGDPVKRGARADLVLLLDVLEHCTHPADLLRAISQLAPRAILRVPIERSLRDLLRPQHQRRAASQFGHLHHWWRSEVLHLVTSAGMRITRAQVVFVPIVDADRWTGLGARARAALFRRAPSAVDLAGAGSLLIACEAR